jgi:hypothetical protein
MRKSLFPCAVLLFGVFASPLVLAQHVDGKISGVVVGSTGQPLTGQQVELRRPGREGPGRLVVMTNADGEFEYTGLGPGRYQVEWRIEGRVVATSEPVELSAARAVAHVTIALPNVPPNMKVLIDNLGVGAKVRVTIDRRNGTKVKGYISATDDESVTLTDPNTFRAATIAYNDIVTVKKERSELVKLLIFVGVSTGVLLAGTVITIVAAGGG